MLFETVAHMYGRYGLVGIAYGTMQAYPLKASDGLEEAVSDFIGLLSMAAIRDVRLGQGLYQTSVIRLYETRCAHHEL